MNLKTMRAFPGVRFGKNVKIKGENVKIQPGVTIGDNVTIEASVIEIGHDVIIERDTTIKSLSGKMTNLYIGDNCLIGFSNRILVPHFSMLDYSQLHNSCLCSGYEELRIGYNCWIGQGAILNSFERLTIGNNVRMGGCQIWTHVASGEVFEGSNFNGSKPVIIEDNVWLMGFGHLVTPGVVLKKSSVIMAGSVVTKSTIPFHTYSGMPAKDITEKLPAWKKLTWEEKFKLVKQFIDEFLKYFPKYKSSVHLYINSKERREFDKIRRSKGKKIIIVDKLSSRRDLISEHTIFDLSTKQYSKKRSDVELDWMKFNLGYRIRFTPFQMK